MPSVKSKLYLVTGGAGFIGSFLCERLIASNHKVVCLDNLSTGSEENIKDLLQSKNFTFINTDVSSTGELKKIPTLPYDYILHLASPAGPNTKSPKSYHQLWQETYLVNCLGTHLLCKRASRIGSTFLFASSSEIYGNPKIHPQKESYLGNVNPIGPRAIYDESKRMGEAITANFTRHSNLNTRIVRIFNTYGPRMNIQDGRALPLFIYQTLTGKNITVYGEGTQTRSFCYIDDLIDGIVKLLDCPEANALPVNLGNPDELKLLELLDKIKNIAGYQPKIIYHPLPEDDPQRRQPDITRAKKLLGWQPKISLDKGLKITFDYFKKKLSKSL